MEPFQIEVDSPRRSLRATLRGFWDDATARRFVTELERSVTTMRRPGKPCYWLIDTSDGTPQSQTATALMQEAVARLTKGGFSYVAVVVPSALVAMQVRRVKTEGHEMFTDHAAAEAWLAERRAEEGIPS